MLAAKRGRQEQLEILEAYLAGEPVEFKSHQGKGYETQRDPDADNKTRAPTKIVFEKQTLFLDAAGLSDVDTVEKMLKDGMDPNVRNADGLTALHQGCIENSLKLVTTLVNNGADVDATDNDWWTPLHAAAACGHWRITNFLITKGADITMVNADGDLAIDIVEGEKTTSILEEEMKHRGISDEELDEIRGRSEKNLREAVEKMIAEGADLNTPDEHGVYLVHFAACNGYHEVMELLLKNGANPNKQDPEGCTALHLASFFQEYRIAELLGKHGIDTTIPNKHNEPAIILTEDVTMIRLIKAIANHQEVESVADTKRERLNSSVKRRSINQKQNLAKKDIQREGKDIETNYAELSFAGKQSKDSPAKANASTVYAELDLPSGKEAAKTDHVKLEADEQEKAASMYATPVKKGERRQSAAEGKDAVQKKNPKVAKSPVPRKGSLAAIAVKDGEQQVEQKKGGCCIIA